MPYARILPNSHCYSSNPRIGRVVRIDPYLNTVWYAPDGAWWEVLNTATSCPYVSLQEFLDTFGLVLCSQREALEALYGGNPSAPIIPNTKTGT